MGRVYKYGDNVDTDVIIPARYLNTSEPSELAKHCMEDIDSSFSGSVENGDFIVADKNFGCGSSREHAPIAIKAAGVKCVIASSFARIFFRNCINIGLPIMECPEAAEKIEAGDDIDVNFDTGVITNKTKGETYQSQPLPEFLQNLIAQDGLINYTKSKLAEENK
ncbi:MAG: 3-isopropylmalate dehydratase small subunit [Anaerovoracaceae bacterium]|nr:3-isopropylmalate dehydratase small subunit [Bacillota bacterium]MDY2670773.1 3-isopropylmalate dehydratase small subunit [Anaerovoracaceae bacterium]